jgi:hypothetical protein
VQLIEMLAQIGSGFRIEFQERFWCARELVRRGLHAADELPLLLKALEIDDAALERTHPLVLRDMERVCTLCRHKAKCDMDLADGTSAEDFSSYCPNESTIKQLERTGAARRV